ncbi:MAG: ATP-binding protein [Candidatus Thermoplasmatota archaeon]|nr:ATP-binding protein [Candidatus Thermoplasmatota archaeon]MCL5988209.1 ATP-binding protein [Candidatus Thermoplasmatota archaeon]
MGSDYLAIDNIKQVISEDIRTEKKAEDGGDLERAISLCKSIIGNLKIVSEMDSKYSKKYNDVIEIWEKRVREMESGKTPRSRPRGHPATGSSGNGKAAANDGLIGKMEGEFRARIESLISKSNIKWSEIGGLEEEKGSIMEAVFFAIASPDVNINVPKLRNILLFGPPGTGKTTIAKAISSNIDATFFNVTISELLSRYVGDSERLVSKLYDTARDMSPSVVFIDEIESLVRKRDENKSTTSVLQQFLGQLDGFSTGEQFVLTVAATNIPWELDQAILSRFEKKIYIGLPDPGTRKRILEINTKDKGYTVNANLSGIASRTENFSGRDLNFLCSDAIRTMLRRANSDLIGKLDSGVSNGSKMNYRVKPLEESDFMQAMERTKPASDRETLNQYMKWKSRFASN